MLYVREFFYLYMFIFNIKNPAEAGFLSILMES